MKWGPPRARLSADEREAVYKTACGGDPFPICNICFQPIRAERKWVISHMPTPRALDGTVTGIAHKKCNDLRWRTIEAPMVAKAKSQYKTARDIKASSRNPLPGGKDDPLRRKKKVTGEVIDRDTGKPWGDRR
jgi:hypothetical protein